MPTDTGDDGAEQPKKSFRIRQDDEFCRRLLSREEASGGAASSFRVYHTVALASIPFQWESRPGMPKNDAAAAAKLPPLTPPPSHQYRVEKSPSSTLPGPGSRRMPSTSRPSLVSKSAGILASILRDRLRWLQKKPPLQASTSPSSTSSLTSTTHVTLMYYINIGTGSDFGVEETVDNSGRRSPANSVSCFPRGRQRC